MGALARLRFPSSFVMMLDLTFQHIRLMLDTVSRMFLARRSRMVGKTTNRELRQIGGSAVAHLFSRSFHMGEQVFLAMRARGYTGRPRLLGEPAARPADYGFAASLLAVGVALVLFDGPYAGWYLGRLVLFLGGIP
jgi:cobalt/nickel transport system permease protein